MSPSAKYALMTFTAFLTLAVVFKLFRGKKGKGKRSSGKRYGMI